MPINTALLIAAPMLQDSFVDKDGTPMAGGTVTCYQDKSRTTLKNWYYQSGSPGSYTYIPLPNPLTLSAAGTICDINGVDTIPFFYPYSELDETQPQPYYITIVNYAQTNQITRANFPFISSTGGSAGTGTAFNNLIVNNGFWRNAQPNTLTSPSNLSIVLSTPFLTVQTVSIGTLTTVYAGIVAPSQHDTFSFPDIQFVKNNITASETCTFTPFPLNNQLVITKPYSTNTPEYYISHNCTSAGSAETLKCYQFPIALHINNLANLNYTVSLQAQNGGTIGAGSVITLQILQFTGTGTTSPAPFVVSETTITTTTAWAVYTLSDVFPTSSGLTLANASDDAFYLQVQMPLNTPCTINFTKPSLYLTSNTVPAFDFQTYDEVDTVINSPRTGDIRTSINSFYPFGWVPMNDGTIGYNSNSMATYLPTALNSQQTWPLYSLIWNLFKPYTGISSNPISPMINSSGSSIAYGATAIADFNANNSLTLTKMMGRIMLGTVPAVAEIKTYSTTFTASNSGGNLLLTAANTVNYFNGMPVYVSGGSLPSTIGANTIYYVAGFNGSTAFFLSTTFANALAGTVIGYAAGSGTVVSAPAGTTEGEYAHAQLLSELIGHTHAATAGAFVLTSGTGVGYTSGGSNLGTSALTAASGGSLPFNVTQPGTFYNIFMKL